MDKVSLLESRRRAEASMEYHAILRGALREMFHAWLEKEAKTLDKETE